MNLEARKLSLIQEFLRIDNEKVISALESFIHNNNNNNSEVFEQNLKPMSLNQLNIEIDQALDDDKNNRLISTKDLKNQLQKWS